MLMVVYSHVLTFSMGNISPSPLGSLMIDVMLPLFFFISGFCAYKERGVPTLHDFGQNVINKTRSILIPTVIMFIVFMLYSGNDVLSFLFRYDKSGYWFTWVLFQILVIYSWFEVLAFKTCNIWLKVFVRLLPLGLLWVFSKTVGFDNNAAVLFEWIKVKEYYLYFIVGIFTHWFYPRVILLLNNNMINALLLIIAVVAYQFIANGIMRVFMVLIFFYVYNKLDGWFSMPNNKISNVLRLIGENTLQVYFIHFFLLFAIPVIPKWLMSLQHDVCFGTHSCSSMVEFCICGTLAVIISFVCIYIQKIIGLFPWIYTLCFGSNSHVSKI